MSLIKCIECKNELSDKAVSCPHCGYPIQQSLKQSGNDDLYCLKLIDSSNCIKAMKIVREVFNMNLQEAKDLVNSSPVILAKGVTREEVTRLSQPFYDNFIKVEISKNDGSINDIGIKPQAPKNKYYSNEPLYNISRDSVLFNQPKCPTCNSANIQKISITQKVVGGAMFGLFSGKARKTFECKSCGYTW